MALVDPTLNTDWVSQSSPAYPHDREAEIALRDGSTVHVRPVRNDDEVPIREFFEGISQQSIGFRFFGVPDLRWATRWSLDVDYADRYGLVAESGEPRRIIAHAAYVRVGSERQPGSSAEVAFLVADPWQGKGISTILLAQLATVATAHGIVTFTAEVLPNNHRMIEVFRDSGFPVSMRALPGAIEIELPTSLNPEAIARFEDRERLAAVAAVRSVLEPRSVAVIGASRRRGTIGGELLHNLLEGRFSGSIYVVNPNAEVIQSLPAYRSVGDIPGEVELAVVAVQADQVVAVARECAAAGVRALLVISSGFAEVGAVGARRQRDLVVACRAAGIRIVGPNCLGVINTAADTSLNATFGPPVVSAGNVGFVSQSGGLGIAMIEEAGRLGLGISSLVSVGNKSDLSANDFLEYWAQDRGTNVALLYLESFGNPRKFARIARRVSLSKPVVAVKSGRSAAGARATSSHTGAILEASDVTVDALFEQAGVIRTDTMRELFDVAALMSSQPVPRGERLAIVTNAGGPGILCADACHAQGVEIAESPEAVRAVLAEFLPVSASLGNPIDMIASATAADYRRTLQALIDADAYDAIIVIFVPGLVTPSNEVAAAIREVAETNPHVTIAAVFMVRGGSPSELRSEQVHVPCYGFPEDAARAMVLAARHGQWGVRNAGSVPELDRVCAARAAAIISRALADGEGWLSPAAVTALFDCYGLPLIPTRIVADASQAIAAAAEFQTPVALKASASGLVHKTDVGGVRLGLEDAEAIGAATHEIEAALARTGHQLDGLIVQPMAPNGVELIVGVVHDDSFGPVLVCGAGGTATELINDVAVRITPVTDVDAHQMLRALRIFPLLDGYRGAPRCDLAAIEDVLLRVSAAVEAHPEIVELDCNPLIAIPDGAVIVDARVRVETSHGLAPVASLDA
jgi:acetyl coenzyme A synthetase (ADP forming)-like protein